MIDFQKNYDSDYTANTVVRVPIFIHANLTPIWCNVADLLRNDPVEFGTATNNNKCSHDETGERVFIHLPID